MTIAYEFRVLPSYFVP